MTGKAKVKVKKQSVSQDLIIIETDVVINGHSRKKRYTVPVGSTSEQITEHIKKEVKKEANMIVGNEFEVEL